MLAALWIAGELSAHAADETSTGDKLRILYSNRFTFDDRGIPVLTVAIATGLDAATITAPGLVVLPGGEGGARIRAGTTWTITAEGAVAAKTRKRLIVDRTEPENQPAITAAVATWKQRGFDPRLEQVGAIFGIAGDVIDTRETFITVEHSARARAIAEGHGIDTATHRTLARRPRATLIATSDDASPEQGRRVTIRNPSILWLRPSDPRDTITVHDVPVGGGGAREARKTATRRYHGAIYVTVGRDGKLAVVNAVSADDLLAGLVPAEMYPGAHPAALRAQAIAARTNLIGKLGRRHTADPYLLCATQHCQVYAGAGRETGATTRAVRATRGQVLVGRGGSLVDARYSAACGGHTEHNNLVWAEPADPTLRGRLDAPDGGAAPVTSADVAKFLADRPGFCAQSRFAPGRYRWSAKVSAALIRANLRARGIDIGAVKELVVRRRGVSGRIIRLLIRGDGGNTEIRGELSIRRLLGGLKSSLFIATPIREGGQVVGFSLRGGGFGHGVGMCQLGAMTMARTGTNTSEILAHYYNQARIARLY